MLVQTITEPPYEVGKLPGKLDARLDKNNNKMGHFVFFCGLASPLFDLVFEKPVYP